ncbi:MAG: neutral/alkaline non-lysosomal ceramidase N-terminal domain-containing protein [Planctomycetaceae bacterium]
MFSDVESAEAGWKASVARANITPETKIWMAGYGSRTEPTIGKRQDLWLKAVALEDEKGHRAIGFSSDLLGIPQSIYNNVCEELNKQYQLSRADIMLNSSHTHSGPVLRGALLDIYPLDDEQLKLIEDYSNELEATPFVRLTGEALNALQPVTLQAGTGSTDVAVNRRNNTESEVAALRERGDELKGPVDHAVPVLAIHNSSSELIAVIFGYACHNTVMSDNYLHGDYAGYAQAAIEEAHPGTTALFYMGCGGDQNPLPRRDVKLLTVYGNKVAQAVDEVLADQSRLKSLPAKLETSHQFVELNLADPPSNEELTAIAENDKRGAYQQRWAKRLLSEREAGKTFITSYPLPLQAWEIGDEQLWLTMGGEAVVDYALGFKKMFGDETWVAAYCNDVPAYIPSLRVLEEDKVRLGYEGYSSMIVYGMPAYRWADDVEDLISKTMTKLVADVRP